MTDGIRSGIIPLMFRRRWFPLSALLLLAVLAFSTSTLPLSDQLERARAFTRPFEFDYISWTLNALGIKWGQASLETTSYLSPGNESQVVLKYLALVQQIWEVEAQVSDIYADPKVSDPEAASVDVRKQRDDLYAQRRLLQPLAESVLQDQVSAVAAEMGLSLGGQVIPPVLFHTTAPPDALIISPRDVIRQDADISISPDLTVDQMTALEEGVDKNLNVSSLVVGIGGIGLYPTMVMQTTDINWLAEVVAHEWVHNYLTLRPLGLSYMNGPTLRTMNETTASIAGKEIGREVIARYYPDHLPPPPEPTPTPSPEKTEQPPAQPEFDFRKEMHTTRLTVDALLAEGKIESAEAYMEQRRLFFWDHGYHIRKLNQAYFAFYGAYADEPGGAAGAAEDPVGEAVRALRAISPSLASFINRISWMWSFDQLQRAVK